MTDVVGRRFGNYRLLRLLGEGSFAEVYLGEHLHLGSLAAIKVLHHRLGQEDQEHFHREARIIVRLKHPNIVRLLEYGIEGSTPFLVMDYAPGGTLRQRHLKGHPLPLATTLPYVRQVADALQYAHLQQVIHRDIKPENLLVGERGEVLLSDFGIATVAQSSRSQGSEDAAGTAAYMAPEQFLGKPRVASDQYALGIVVYEWLTGTCPFQGSFLELSGQHLHRPPPSLQDQLPGLSPAVEQVVLTALAKDPQQRFVNVQAFASALEQAGGMAPVAANPSAFNPSQLEPSAPAEPVLQAKQGAGLWPLTPTRHEDAREQEPTTPVHSVAPPAYWLAPTVRVAAPSGGTAPRPAGPRTKHGWINGLLVGLFVLTLMSGGLLGVGLVGKGPLAFLGGSQTPIAIRVPREALGALTEFALPTTQSQPYGITVGPDGNLWFTEFLYQANISNEYTGSQIGRITPEGVLTEFVLPASNAAPAGITAGPDGKVWFAEANTGSIGRITPGGTITSFALPTSQNQPYRITTGPDGNLWFTENSGQIGRITPEGVITEFAVSSLQDQTHGITVGPGGTLWFTEFGSGKIGRLTSEGAITEFALPLATSAPEDITAGPDGNLWFTEEYGNQIGRITPAGKITEFPLPTANSAPFGVTRGPDGNLWFTEAGSNKIGRITPAGILTEFAVPTARSFPAGIITGPDGNLWFTEFAGDHIGRISPGP